MTEPDFSDITGGEAPESKSTDRKQSNRGHHQVHIKGRWGTSTYDDTEDCVVCGRKPDAILLVGVDPAADHDNHDSVRHVCDHHEGDVRGDLEYHHEQVKRVDF